jgi:hypothetical protein
MDHAAIGIAQLVNNITGGQERLADRQASFRRAQTVKDAIRAVGQLQAENAELRLYLATVICLLMSKGVITQEEFAELSTAIDGMDGVADGRFDGQIAPDGTVGASAETRKDVALRELSAAVKKMGR